MGTPDPSSSLSRNFPHPAYNIPRSPSSSTPSSPTTKYIGVPEEWISHSSLHPQIQSLFTQTLQHLTATSSSNPYKIMPLTIPHLPSSRLSHSLDCLLQASTLFTHPSQTPSSFSKLTPQSQILLSLPPLHATAISHHAALRLRSLLMSHFSHLFTRYPGLIILTPTTPCAGYPVSHPQDIAKEGYGFFNPGKTLEIMQFAWLANFLGCPAISVPMGYVDPVARDRRVVDGDDEGGVPVGLMAMGEWGSEEALIEWGKGMGDGREAKRPRGKGGRWVDVVGLASERKNGDDLKKGQEQEEEEA